MKNLCVSTNVIAKICNVSQGTVDRALNNRPGIRASTKQRILNVAKQYGYREHIKADAGKAGKVQRNYFCRKYCENHVCVR